MKRRDVLALLGLAPLAVRAQAKKVYRIGVLEATPLKLNAENLEHFKKGMAERGYREGPEMVILYRSAEGHTERFAALAGELVQQKVDLILVRGTPAALAAQRASASLPVVMAAVSDPVEAKLAASLARPGGRVTGLTSTTAELVPKRLEILKALAPKMTRVAAYANLSNVAAANTWRETEVAARALGLEPLLIDVRRPEQIEAAFETAVKQQAEGLIVGVETLTQSNRKAIVALAAKHRLPAIYAAREFVDEGGLASYGVSYPDLYYRAAEYADRIFKGAKPADLPIGRPTKFALYFNRVTAHNLKILVPPDLLLRADRVLD